MSDLIYTLDEDVILTEVDGGHGVRLTHIDTGMQAICLDHKSQHANRLAALNILIETLSVIGIELDDDIWVEED